jgi:hypothetical protein
LSVAVAAILTGHANDCPFPCEPFDFAQYDLVK